MARSYQNAELNATGLDPIALECLEFCVQFSGWMKKIGAMLVACFLVSVTAGCSNSADSVNTNVASNTVTANTEAVEPSAIVDGAASSNPIQPIDDQTIAPIFSDMEMPSGDSSAIADTDVELTRLLSTKFIVESQQIVPITGWICTDGIGKNRIYYFYQLGVLDAIRNVAIERTLNPNSTYNDINFFWSVTASDAIVMTSANTDDNGMLISSGRQYDVNSIRFGEVESVQTFVAESVLRGRLVCGNYDFS